MNKVKALFFSIFLVCSVSFVNAQSLQEAGAKFDEARELLKSNKFEEAIPVLEKSIEIADAILDDENAPLLSEQAKKLYAQVFLKLGGDNAKSGNFDQAIAMFGKAEEVASMYGIGDIKRQAARLGSTAYLTKGITMFNEGKYADALEVFKKGYEQDGKNVKLALFTAQAYAETSDLTNAAALFKQVIETGAENSKYAEDAAKAKSDLSKYFVYEASKLAKEGDLNKVIEIVDQVIVIDPSIVEAQIIPIQLANNQKKYDVVIERGVKALANIQDQSAISDINLLLGVAYQNKENKVKALEALNKVTGDKADEAKAIIAEINK